MIELWECSEADCDALIDISYKAPWEKKVVYCRWHMKRPKQPPKPQGYEVFVGPTDVEHVSHRVGECFYCGFVENLTRDHVIPKSRGKQYRGPWNCVWACEFCNRKKANKDLAVWLRDMVHFAPTHPKYEAIVARTANIVNHLLTDDYHAQLRLHRIKIDPQHRESA